MEITKGTKKYISNLARCGKGYQGELSPEKKLE